MVASFFQPETNIKCFKYQETLSLSHTPLKKNCFKIQLVIKHFVFSFLAANGLCRALNWHPVPDFCARTQAFYSVVCRQNVTLAGWHASQDSRTAKVALQFLKKLFQPPSSLAMSIDMAIGLSQMAY